MKVQSELELERAVKMALARQIMDQDRFEGASPQRALAPVKPLPLTMMTILVPTDFSSGAVRLITYARLLAVQFSARLTLLHVIDPITYTPAHCWPAYVPELRELRRKVATENLTALAKKAVEALPLSKSVICSVELAEGDAADEVARVARESGADLLVISTHGYTGFKHLISGSRAERMVRYAPCPVLVLREQELGDDAVPQAQNKRNGCSRENNQDGKRIHYSFKEMSSRE
jgi:universal stress protein A